MKRVLIVTYNWPPAGGISLLRCLKFVKYLKDFKWEPIVYTAKNAQYPTYDDSNFKHIPEGTMVLKHRISEPFNLFKKITGRKKGESLNNIIHIRKGKKSWLDTIAIFIRGNFFIPDARSFWIKPSIKFLSAYLKNNPVDAILSNGPPHTNTVIATKLSKIFNIPFLADFQDPWTQVDYYKLMMITKWSDKKHKRLEQNTFKQASKITIASPTWKSNLEQIGANNVDVLYWGYDEDEFDKNPVGLDKQFTLLHCGLMGFDRKPDKLFEVLAEMVKEDESFASDLKIKLTGQLDYSIFKKIESLKLNNYVQHLVFIPRDEVLKETVKARVLLLFLNKATNAKGRIPGKLFEYLRAQRPILCCGPTNSDVSKILLETGSGCNYDYQDKKGIKQFLKREYSSFCERNDRQHKNNDISQYFVRNQVKMLAQYLNEISTNG